MAKQTPNFGFKKTDVNEFYDVNVQNENWDKVDELFKSLSTPFTESEEHPGCFYRMVDDEKEWINPPMLDGVEYRTTERANGKAVYIQRLYYGYDITRYTSSITIPFEQAYENLQAVTGYYTKTESDSSINRYILGQGADTSQIYIPSDETNIYVVIDTNHILREICVMLKYTKSTS